MEVQKLCGEDNKQTFFENLAEKINPTDNDVIFKEMEGIIFRQAANVGRTE